MPHLPPPSFPTASAAVPPHPDNSCLADVSLAQPAQSAPTAQQAPAETAISESAAAQRLRHLFRRTPLHMQRSAFQRAVYAYRGEELM